MVMKIVQCFMMLGWLCLSPQWAMADNATASLDRSISSWGESVTLQIHVDGSADKEPDLSVLKHDFEILSQSQSSNYSLINGSLSRSKAWSVRLMPKHQGALEIPPISLGNMKTNPLSLQVVAQQQVTGIQGKDVYLEVSASLQSVYVQAQVLLTVKLFRAVNLAQAQLTELDIPHAIIKKLGEDKNYETLRDQRRFIVTERRYAIFPEQSGTLHVPALQFTGQLINQVGMFNQGGRVLRVQSKALDIVVLPMPNTWTQTAPWLPAKSLTIREIPMDNQAGDLKVGEPLTRTIEIRAEGLTAEQLPQLFSHVSNHAFKQYPDKPELSTEVDGHGVVGLRREKVAMMPTQAGELSLPALSVSWWDTTTHTLRKARILKRTITVAKSNTQSAQKLAISKPLLQSKPAAKAVVEPQYINHNKQTNVSLWQGLAVFFAVAWLLSMGLWWRSNLGRKNKNSEDIPLDKSAQSVKKLRKKLEFACKTGKAKEVEALLPQWAAAFLDDEYINYIGQLKGRSDALDMALLDLEASLYGNENKQPWQGDAILEAISELHLPTKELQPLGLKTLA